MLTPNEYLVQERQQELLREAEKIRLLHLVKEGLTDRLHKYGASLLKGKDKPPTHSHN